jgi:endonuclease YncB( thermonuclease family)
MKAVARILLGLLAIESVAFTIVLAQTGEKGLLPVFPPEQGRYQVYINRIIDGDTVEFYWLVKCEGRLDGINAPEVHGDQKPMGLISKAKLAEYLPQGMYEIDTKGKEKYGRTLVVIFKGKDNVNKLMVDGGFAKPYSGEGPRP